MKFAVVNGYIHRFIDVRKCDQHLNDAVILIKIACRLFLPTQKI